MSWDDARAFADWLNATDKTKPAGAAYRLPTEAEGEYACRAGTATHFSFGDSDADLADHAWFFGNSGLRTHPVGEKSPNPWGLCDMHGNVWEWCADLFGPYPAGNQQDPVGPRNGAWLVLRGGSWNHVPRLCRSAYRGGCPPGTRYHFDGLRVVFVPGP